MSTAKRILLYGGGGLTFSHAINILGGRPMWWWIAVTYSGLAAAVIYAHWRATHQQ